jgi:hypothetical protein
MTRIGTLGLQTREWDFRKIEIPEVDALAKHCPIGSLICSTACPLRDTCMQLMLISPPAARRSARPYHALRSQQTTVSMEAHASHCTADLCTTHAAAVPLSDDNFLPASIGAQHLPPCCALQVPGRAPRGIGAAGVLVRAGFFPGPAIRMHHVGVGGQDGGATILRYHNGSHGVNTVCCVLLLGAADCCWP